MPIAHNAEAPRRALAAATAPPPTSPEPTALRNAPTNTVAEAQPTEAGQSIKGMEQVSATWPAATKLGVGEPPVVPATKEAELGAPPGPADKADTTQPGTKGPGAAAATVEERPTSDEAVSADLGEVTATPAGAAGAQAERTPETKFTSGAAVEGRPGVQGVDRAQNEDAVEDRPAKQGDSEETKVAIDETAPLAGRAAGGGATDAAATPEAGGGGVIPNAAGATPEPEGGGDEEAAPGSGPTTVPTSSASLALNMTNQAPPAQSTAAEGGVPSEAQSQTRDAGADLFAFAAAVAAQRADILASDIDRQARITAATTTGKGAVRAKIDAAVIAVESAHENVITDIQARSQADQGAVLTALTAALARVDVSADAELAKVAAAVQDTRKLLQTNATSKSGESIRIGEEQGTRVAASSADFGRQAQAIGEQKVSQHRGGDKGPEVSRGIRTQASQMVAALTSAGQKAAAEVRNKAADLAGKFRSEGNEAAEKLTDPGRDARTKITETRDESKEGLREIAQSAMAKIAETARTVTADVRNGKTASVMALREAAPAMDNALDLQSDEAKAKVTAETAAIVNDLDAAVAKVNGGLWYPPFLTQAQTEITAGLAGQKAELDGFVDRVVGSLGQTAAAAEWELGTQLAALVDGVQKMGTDFAAGSDRIVGDAVTGLQDATGLASTGMESVAPALAEKLQSAANDIDRRWADQLARHRTDITGQVDRTLVGEAHAVAGFGSALDRATAQITSTSGFFANLLDFVIGTFEGIMLGARDLLKSLWEAIKTPLFWIVVAVIIIAVIIVAFAAGVTIGAVLAVVGKVLLVIGVVVGVIAAGYYIYLMITKPDLTWRERGQLLGKAIFELVLAFAGTGILKRLGVFTQVTRLIRFVEVVGGISKALRLIHLLPDLDKLIILIDRVGEAEKLILLLRKVRDGEVLLKLLDKVQDIDQLLKLLDKVENGTTLLRLLSLPKITEVAVLEKLLAHAKLSDLSALEKLLKDAKIADVEELLALVDNAKVTDAAHLNRLLERFQSGSQLKRLLALPEFATGTVLEHLADTLARAGWPEATRGAELADLALAQLAHPAVLSEVEAAIAAQEAGKITGLKDWLQFNAPKGAGELFDSVLELRDARRLADENPGKVVRVGREAHAPKRPGTTERLPEFDLGIETPSGVVLASVEITSVEKPISKASDVTDGVRHAIDKVAARAGSTPVRGSPQVIIHVTLDLGERTRGGTTVQILLDGTVNILRKDGSIVKSSNLFEDLAVNLSTIKNNTVLDRVTLIDQGGRPIIFLRKGTSWGRL
jgi:hypothetical protein